MVDPLLLLLFLAIGVFALIYGFIVKKLIYLFIAVILILLFVSQSGDVINYFSYLLL